MASQNLAIIVQYFALKFPKVKVVCYSERERENAHGLAHKGVLVIHKRVEGWGGERFSAGQKEREREA